MLELRREIRVEWGHCDPARIVYNPAYFQWMESGVHLLFEVAGIDLEHAARRDPDSRGVPLVRSEAQFEAPARLGDILVQSVGVTRWGNKSFDVTHQFRLGERLLLKAVQIRVWGRAAQDDPDRLVAMPVPDEIKAALSADAVVRVTRAQDRQDGPPGS